MSNFTDEQLSKARQIIVEDLTGPRLHLLQDPELKIMKFFYGGKKNNKHQLLGFFESKFIVDEYEQYSPAGEKPSECEYEWKVEANFEGSLGADDEYNIQYDWDINLNHKPEIVNDMVEILDNGDILQIQLLKN